MTICIATDSCTKGAAIGHVCHGHHERLGQMLADLEMEAAILSAVPSMQIRMDAGGGSLASERAPVRLDVLVHTDRRRGTGRSETDDDAFAAGETLSILDVLHSWARVVREDRDLTDTGPVTITGERALLTRHLDWCAEQEWIGEMFRELRDLTGQLKAANGHRADRPYSRCPVIRDGQACSGDVWVRDEVQPVWRRYIDRCAQTWEPAPGSANCDTCDASWTTEGEKARLRRMVKDQADDAAREAQRPHTDDGRPMLTAEELAQQVGTSVNAVRLRLSRARVRAVSGHYHPDALTDVAV